jgi:hypothetical protein
VLSTATAATTESGKLPPLLCLPGGKLADIWDGSRRCPKTREAEMELSEDGLGRINFQSGMHENRSYRLGPSILSHQSSQQLLRAKEPFLPTVNATTVFV